jgi:hypothetical protein
MTEYINVFSVLFLSLISHNPLAALGTLFGDSARESIACAQTSMQILVRV